jgi:hypothetical protein
VEFYGIGIDPSETPDELEDLKAREGYAYEIGYPVGNIVADLRILKQSSKVAIDGTGVITYRAGFGGGDVDEWAKMLSELADTRTAPVSAPAPAAVPTQPAQVAAAVPTSAPTSSPVPQPTDTPEPTATPVPQPTDTPVPAPAATSTATVVLGSSTQNTATPVPQPTDTPTPAPTATPTAAPTSTPTPVPTNTPTPEPTATPTPEPTPTPAPQADVGNKVGNLSPEFALRLVDGTEITATELRMEGRPVFLYFLTGW